MVPASVALLLLTLVVSLAGCSYTTTNDPLLVAQVNGANITLAAYQTLLPFSIAKAEYDAENPNSNSAPTPIDWRIANQRDAYAQAQQTTLDSLIDLELTREQLRAQHITVSASALRDAQTQITATLITYRQQFTQDPTNSALEALIDSLNSTTVQLLAEQSAGLTALAQHGKLPRVHVSEIVVVGRKQAEHVLTLAQHGASFTTLAKTYSTTGSTASDLGTIYPGELSYEAYLEAQQNVPSQFSSGVGASFDKLVFAPQRTPAFVLLPLAQGGGYGVFHITQAPQGSLASVKDQSIQLSIIAGWIADTLYTRAQIRQYIVVG